MNRRDVSYYFLAAVLLLALIDPSVVFPREEKAYIEFERVGVSGHHADVYIVKEGECLFNIVRKEYAVSRRDAFHVLELVGRLNPQLEDIDVIYPGQKLFLPRKIPSGAAPRGHVSATGFPDKRDGDDVLKYTVRKGDTISEIIHGFGNPYREVYRILGLVRRLNPEIKDLDNIYPGQTLVLPSSVRRGIRSPAETGDITIPQYKILPVVGNIVERMHGVIITDGMFRIPIPPAGEVTIDCSKVPVIEMDGGNMILFDLSDRIPADLKELIESAWTTYRVVGVREGETVPSLLERIIRAADGYTLEKANRQIGVGGAPAVRVFVDWIVSRGAENTGTDRYAFTFVRAASDLIPLPVKRYMERNGLESIEIMDDIGITGDETVYQTPSARTLESGNGIVLAESLLRALGHVPVRRGEVTVLSTEGLTLSLKTELSLDVGGRLILITSRRVSDRMRSILEERGDRVVSVSEEKGRGEIIEDIARAVEIPSSSGNFRFFFSRHAGKGRGDISIPALRLGGEGGIYLVACDVDRDIEALLYKEWKVTLVRY